MSMLLRTCKTARIYNKYIHTSVANMMLPNQNKTDAAPVDAQKTVEETAKKAPINMSHAYKPDNLEKRFLVWTKKYKSVEDVPDMVSREEMEKSRSKIRIRLSNILMVVCLIGCYFMVRSGKKAAEKGETVQKMNIDWHKQYNEEHKAESK